MLIKALLLRQMARLRGARAAKRSKDWPEGARSMIEK